MYVVILEPDRIIAKLLKTHLREKNITADIAPTPDAAMKLIDTTVPDLLITELSLSGHSALEFLYELRTYPDLQDLPVVVYTSLLLDDKVRKSLDWTLLKITHDFYKPHASINNVVASATTILES